MPNGQDYAAPFFRERERSRQEQTQRAAYAAQIAESLGGYTPELEAQVLAPLGQYPTIGEHLMGAPVRALGQLTGIERFQQVGAVQPFEMGQLPPAAAPGAMPGLPTGLPPDMQQALTAIAQSQGYGPPAERAPTVPAVPSETTGRARLKTKGEREREIRNQEQMWDFIMKNYQSQQERELTEAKILQMQQSTMESEARIREIDDRIERGLPATEAQLVKEHMEATGMDYIETMRKLQGLKGQPTAILQLFRHAQQEEGYKGTLTEFTGALERAKWNIVDASSELFYDNPFAAFQFPMEEHPERIAGIAQGIKAAMDQIYDKEDIKLPPPAETTPVPDELAALGVTERDLTQLQEAEGLTREGAIKMYMDYLKQRGAQSGTAGRAGAGTPKTE